MFVKNVINYSGQCVPLVYGEQYTAETARGERVSGKLTDINLSEHTATIEGKIVNVKTIKKL